MKHCLLCIVLFLSGTRLEGEAPKPTPKYYLAVWSMFQNEADWLKEWIEFHLLVGVDHFYLYDNASSDHFREVLQPYIERGVVELISWPDTSGPYPPIQQKAMLHCWQQRKHETQWLISMDADEFVFPVKDWDLKTFLKRYEAYAAVAVNWQMYGTGGVKNIQPSELMIEKLLLKAETQYWRNHTIKTFVQPLRATGSINNHWWQYRPGDYAVDSDGHRVPEILNTRVPVDAVRMNHYWCRTEDWAYGPKSERVWLDPNYLPKTLAEAQALMRKWDNKYNKVQDTAILRFVPALKQHMSEQR